MDFKDSVRQLGERVARLKEQTLTEEATKHAFVLPFLQCLGYDIFNPSEVHPEFVADVGLKRGEKVDFAIFKDGSPIILLETKHWKQKLDNHDGQLLRYFHVCKAKFSILTNGVEYRFYTDLVDTNKMDEQPFLTFDITAISDTQVEELKKFHKSYFDTNAIVASASELKYMAAIRSILSMELRSPTENFVRFIAKQVYNGAVNERVVNQFTDLIRRSFQQMLSDMVSDRLKSALDQEQQAQSQVEAVGAAPAKDGHIESGRVIETTPDELEAFYIIKSILRQKVDPNRITYRDALSYMAILLDDNNRKPICRLYFNEKKKQIALMDSGKNEVKHEIQDLDWIYRHVDAILSVIDNYQDGK